MKQIRFVFGLICYAVGFSLTMEIAVGNDRPNIVLIMADDMGWSDAGCYGGEIHTPNIDLLSRDGIRFTQFYNNAICGPTRASLLTGLYCQQTGHSGRNWNQPKDFTKCATIGELLQQAGYHTMMVGKWQGRDLAVNRGFDRFFGSNCRAMVSYYNEVVNNQFSLNDRRWKIPEQGFFMTDAFSDYAVEFLEEATQQEKPFFLYAAYIAPHWPLHTREKDIAPYREKYLNAGWDEHRAARFQKQKEMGLIPASWKLSPKPKGVGNWRDDRYKTWQAERMAAFAGQITCMDRGIGRILKTLKDAGVEENTLVMFLSDNGAARNGGLVPSTKLFSETLKNPKWRLDGVPIRAGSGPDLQPGPHDTFAAYGHAWANVSNTPLNDFKATTYEGGIRTPLVVRWPKIIKHGNQFTPQTGHVMDLMATCLDVAGSKYPNKFQGRTLVPLEGKSLVSIFGGKQRAGHEELCWNAFGEAIRMGNWKLVRFNNSKAWELYNLETDGSETKNLAAKYPERVNEMSAKFAAWKQRVGVK
jgi:arylsulfatase A-like enzyme